VTSASDAFFMQLPNFLLAAPVISISAAAVLEYASRRPLHCASLGGIVPPQLLGRVVKQGTVNKKGFLADGVFVFVAQLAAMVLFGTAFMHIQV
jgi:hypothetical protein